MRRKDLSVAWIDYKKAYDRVPHAWIEQVLYTINAPPQLPLCISNMFPLCKSSFELGRGCGAVKVDLEFQRGLFQGDSLSPLLYCLCITSLSAALRGTDVLPSLGGGDAPVLHGRSEAVCQE
jgi:hypothetical protein